MSELKKNLEAQYYTDPHIYALERQHIFDASWQPVAPVSFFKEKGDYLALDIAGTKIFVIRDDSGASRLPESMSSPGRGFDKRRSRPVSVDSLSVS